MNSQQLFLINLIIVVGVALFFNFRRLKRKQSIKLEPNPTEPVVEVQVEMTPKTDSVKPKSREQIYFVFNGHEWEAFEVLGLQSGVSLETATRHYQELIKNSDPSTFEFYDAAFTSVLKLKRTVSK